MEKGKPRPWFITDIEKEDPDLWMWFITDIEQRQECLRF